MKEIVWGECTHISLSPSANSEDDGEGHWRSASPASCSHITGPDRAKDLIKAILVSEGPSEKVPEPLFPRTCYRHQLSASNFEGLAFGI